MVAGLSSLMQSEVISRSHAKTRNGLRAENEWITKKKVIRNFVDKMKIFLRKPKKMFSRIFILTTWGPCGGIGTFKNSINQRHLGPYDTEVLQRIVYLNLRAWITWLAVP